MGTLELLKMMPNNCCFKEIKTEYEDKKYLMGYLRHGTGVALEVLTTVAVCIHLK